MKPRNKSIMLYLARQWLADNVVSILLLLAVGGGLAIILLNSDTTATEEFATVEFSYNAPGRYSAIDNVLIAKLNNGRIVALSLPTDWVPPMAGNQIRVKRIQKLFFGERFVLLASH